MYLKRTFAIYGLFHPNFVHACVNCFARIWFWTNLSRSHSAHWSRMIGCWLWMQPVPVWLEAAAVLEKKYLGGLAPHHLGGNQG